MIELQSVTWKNFLSYGNKPTTYTFERGISRLAGPNGVGKSTLVDVIHYSFFGRSFRRVNIPKLVNSKNRSGLEVTMKFLAREHPYTIIRGVKPDIFEIYRGDELIDQNATKKGYQTFLEEDVLKFSEDIFQQIGIKSLTRYDSFLTLPKGKRRAIIENIFGIEILSEMRDLNKLRIDTIEEEVRVWNNEVDHYDLLIKQERGNIAKLEAIKLKLEEDLATKNEKIQDEIIGIWKEIGGLEKCLEIIGNYESQHEKVSARVVGLEEKWNNLAIRIQEIQFEMKSADESICIIKEKCPDCPNLKAMVQEKDEALNHRLEILIKEERSNKGIQKTLTTEKIQLENTYLNKRQAAEGKISIHKMQVRKLEASIDETPQTEVEIDDSALLGYEERKAGFQKNVSDSNKKLDYHKAVFGILHDGGIKSYIIKKYLPILNKLMNTYLQRFRIDLELEFNPGMDINVKTKFKENYSYESFSEGEKKRINLALTFTFLEFCKIKFANSSINILLFDEFSFGLDDDGEDDMYGVFRDMVEKEDKEIITFSPVDLEDVEKADRMYKVSIVKGFSKIEIVSDV